MADGSLISILSALDPHEALSDIPRFLLVKEDPVQLGLRAGGQPTRTHTISEASRAFSLCLSQGKRHGSHRVGDWEPQIRG
jgi:hypothetical protein